MQVTLVILALNEEKNLPDCLRSVASLPYPVVVVDSGSTDRTIEIAKAAGAYVLEHPFEDYAKQRNWAQAHLPVESDWVIHLDSDERLTPEIAAEIVELMNHPPENIYGFMFRKRTHFMGRWIRHGAHYPSFHLRLFRRDKGQCENRRYDQHFVVNGATARLKNDYIDVIGSTLSEWSRRHVRWAEMEADELMRGENLSDSVVQPRFFGSPIERKRWLRNRMYGRSTLFIRAFAYWAYRYIFRLGFLDGTQGLIFHFLQGFWFRFLVDSMIWERTVADREARSGDHAATRAAQGSAPV